MWSHTRQLARRRPSYQNTPTQPTIDWGRRSVSIDQSTRRSVLDPLPVLLASCRLYDGQTNAQGRRLLLYKINQIEQLPPQEHIPRPRQLLRILLVRRQADRQYGPPALQLPHIRPQVIRHLWLPTTTNKLNIVKHQLMVKSLFLAGNGLAFSSALM